VAQRHQQHDAGGVAELGGGGHDAGGAFADPQVGGDLPEHRLDQVDVRRRDGAGGGQHRGQATSEHVTRIYGGPPRLAIALRSRGGVDVRIEHIVWDWNGTLFGDSAALIDATIEAFHAAGLPAVTRERYQRHHAQPIPLFYNRLAGRDLSDAEQDALA